MLRYIAACCAHWPTGTNFGFWGGDRPAIVADARPEPPRRFTTPAPMRNPPLRRARNPTRSVCALTSLTGLRQKGS
jgi:hypothetical protein